MSTFVTLGVPYTGDTVWYFGLNKEKEHSSVKLPWLKSSTLFTKSNNLLHFGDVVCTKQFSLVIQTFERTYKSLITAAYCLGLHNSISFYIYIYIFFLSQVPVKPLYLFCLDQNVSKFTPNVSYKPTINCTLTAGNFFVFWIVFIAWRCFDMSIWFNFCASILQRHHLVRLWNSLPVSISEARTAANNIKQDPRLRVAEHAEDWGILICLWLTCDWIKTEFYS